MCLPLVIQKPRRLAFLLAHRHHTGVNTYVPLNPTLLPPPTHPSLLPALLPPPPSPLSLQALPVPSTATPVQHRVNPIALARGLGGTRTLGRGRRPLPSHTSTVGHLAFLSRLWLWVGGDRHKLGSMRLLPLRTWHGPIGVAVGHSRSLSLHLFIELPAERG